MTPASTSRRYQDPLTIQRVLHSAKTIAIVGLSKNELRASYFVGYYLKRHGYHVIPVNPREKEILGEKSYKSLADVPVPIDIVNVFRAPDALPEIAREAVAIARQEPVVPVHRDQRGRGDASRRTAGCRWSWTAASRSSTRDTSAACTGSDSIRSASRRYAADCSNRPSPLEAHSARRARAGSVSDACRAGR